MKKKILAITLCVAMAAIMLVSGTLAYFTDTDEQTNTFTAGKVEITLDEAVVKPDENGDLVADGNNRVAAPSAPAPYHLFPAQSVVKDPTITLTADSEKAYMAAIITVKIPNANLDLMKSDKMSLVHKTHEDMLLVGGLLDGTEYVKTVTPKNHPLSGKNNMLVYGPAEYSIYQIPDSANETWKIYMFFEGAKPAGTEITLFETIEVPSGWNNAEMAVIDGMTINVAAYAAQANGFADCYTAMTTAFPTAFPFGNES